MVKAYKIGIPSKEFLVMPLGYLADLTDASVILDGYADEYIEPEYINVDLRCAPVRCQIYNWWESSLVKPSKLPVPSPWSTKG